MHPARQTPEITQLHAALARLQGLAHPPAQAPQTPRLPLDNGAIDTCLTGGLMINALHEVRCALARDAGCAIGFVLALLSLLAAKHRGRVLWITDPAVAAENLNLFPHAVRAYGLDPDRFVMVHPLDARTAMWAADEAAGCAGLTACVLHLKGNPAALDLTAGRRLTLRAQKSGVFTVLLRQSGAAQAGAAATRWCIAPASSGPQPASGPPDGLARAIGHPCFSLTLERNRSGQTGHWTAAWNPLTKSFGHVTANAPAHPVPASAVSANRPHRPPEMGRIVAFNRPAR